MCGVAEAQRRIAECIETQGETLDLSRLALDLPEDAELWQEIYMCRHVKRLFLGLDTEFRRKYYFDVTQNDKKKCNALGALPGALITALSQLEQLDVGFCSLNHLPENFHDLKQLQSLYLTGTQVSDLGPLSGLKQLLSLNLGHCNLIADFKEIWLMESLRATNLQNASVPGVPAEILKKRLRTRSRRTRRDNCLPRLRSYFTDLENGSEQVRDVKLIILGNGRVGKTQICRRLEGKKFDDGIPSTHGIQIATASLGDNDRKVRLQIWDFGGQDIYHGTHSLFLKSRAAFLLVWAPEMEEEREHEYGGYIYRNEPLPYWVNYVRQATGQEAPVLIVQTRCDGPENEVVRQPVPEALLDGFRFEPQVLQYSAKADRKRGALNEALQEASDWLREQRGGATVIGKGWAQVKHDLEVMRDRDQLLDAEKRENRTLSYERFCQMCKDTGGVSDPDVLLNYLHDTGIVFYREGLFDNEIILDQQWALEAIYAVLEREKSYRRLLLQRGRFTLSDLGDMLWNELKYSKAEQELFLGMMQSCGICFMHRYGDRENGIETEYIAPDLLPEEPDTFAKISVEDEELNAMMEFRFDLLLPGLMRGIISDVGREAGLTADYWRNGVCVYEEHTKSRGIIEQVHDETGWGGSIIIRTCRGQAQALLKVLVEIVQKHEQSFNVTSHRNEVLGEDCAADIREHGEGEVKPGPRFVNEPSDKVRYFVSYGMTHDDYPDIEQEVNRFCKEASRRDVEIIRDRTDLPLGGDIAKFMQRVGAGEHVVVFMSERYLKSENCMYELYEMWRTSEEKGPDFLKRVVVYGIDNTDYRTLEGQIFWAKYWDERYNRLKPDVHYLSSEGFEEFKLIEKFYMHLPKILQTAKSVLQPGSFEELCGVVFGDAEEDLAAG